MHYRLAVVALQQPIHLFDHEFRGVRVGRRMRKHIVQRRLDGGPIHVGEGTADAVTVSVTVSGGRFDGSLKSRKVQTRSRCLER